MPENSTTADQPLSKDSSPGIRIQLKGGNLRTIAMILAIVGGGGGISVGAFQLATQGYVDNAVASQRADSQARAERQAAIDKRQDKDLANHGDGIGKLRIVLGEVQTIQRQQFARDEAKRITEDIGNRERREREYDRIVDLNMWRLKDGHPPCATLACSD